MHCEHCLSAVRGYSQVELTGDRDTRLQGKAKVDEQRVEIWAMTGAGRAERGTTRNPD
jgi:hypothetical protein